MNEMTIKNLAARINRFIIFSIGFPSIYRATNFNLNNVDCHKIPQNGCHKNYNVHNQYVGEHCNIINFYFHLKMVLVCI